MSTKEALLRACEMVGGQTALARKLGISSQGSISNWIKRGRCPPERVLAIEELSGVPRHELRPDIYPIETSKPAKLSAVRV